MNWAHPAPDVPIGLSRRRVVPSSSTPATAGGIPWSWRPLVRWSRKLLTQLHATTVRAGFHPRSRPMWSAFSTENRMSSPPSRPDRSATRVSASIVTPWTTILPPCGNRARQASTSSAVAPPPMNTASGVGSPSGSPSVRSWSITVNCPGTVRFSALARALAARSARRSTPTAVQVGSVRHHSTATDPAPVPRSHSVCPGMGRRAARATARTGCFVMSPSWAKCSSSRPGVRPSFAVSGSMVTAQGYAG